MAMTKKEMLDAVAQMEEVYVSNEQTILEFEREGRERAAEALIDLNNEIMDKIAIVMHCVRKMK